MFSTSIGRVVRSTCAASAPSSFASRCSSAAPLTAAAAAAPLNPRANHQRRQSSSKTSVPPDGSRRAAPSQQAAASTGRVGRRKAKESLIPIDTNSQAFSRHYPHLPSVPSTQHLHPADINVSSFFSCHRPISVTTAVPTPATDTAFGKIFEPRLVGGRPTHADVIFTLGNFVENIEGANASQQGEGLQWQVVQDGAQAEAQHLDGAPRSIPLDKIISQYRPFRPPPPPQPFDEPDAQPEKVVKKARGRPTGARPKKKSWSTTIIVTEFTNPAGEKSYQAASTPIVRVANPSRSAAVAAQPEALSRVATQQPFLQRMLQRRIRWARYRQERYEDAGKTVQKDRSPMLLISVKRQRKLKMKKHKYKKLMKRTRNLRRRLGKI